MADHHREYVHPEVGETLHAELEVGASVEDALLYVRREPARGGEVGQKKPESLKSTF